VVFLQFSSGDLAITIQSSGKFANCPNLQQQQQHYY
jgi:hypothetical protein